jgi:odd-skipped-like protein
LKTHLLTHTDLKPYECPHCNKVFRRNCDLRRHLLTHTITTEEDEIDVVGGGGEEEQTSDPLPEPVSKVTNSKLGFSIDEIMSRR